MDLHFLEFYNFYRSLDLDDHELVQTTNGGVSLIKSINKHFNNDINIDKVITGHSNRTMYRVSFKNEQTRTWFILKHSW